jgi:hypothetical protein
VNRLKLGVLPLVLAVTTHLVASPIATASPKSEKTSQVVLQSVGSQRVFFVVSADAGWVQKKGSDYELSMDLNGIKQIIVFTDRPARLVKYIQKQGLKQAWYAKDVTHNFSENAPNAVLSSQNAKPSVITITHMHMHGSTVHFVFHPIKPGMFSIPVGKIHEVTLTIDKASTSTTSTSKLSTGSIIGITAGSLAAAGGAAGATVAAIKSSTAEAGSETSATETSVTDIEGGGEFTAWAPSPSPSSSTSASDTVQAYGVSIGKPGETISNQQISQIRGNYDNQINPTPESDPPTQTISTNQSELGELDELDQAGEDAGTAVDEGLFAII